jgi:hypothetical protein
MIPNTCDNCPHLKFCVLMDISPLDCERLDTKEFDFEQNAIDLLKGWNEDDEEWHEMSYNRLTEDDLDYGDEEEDE